MNSFLAAAQSRATDVDATRTVLALCCNHCQEVVATADELLKDRVPYKEGAVWAYELDLLDTTAFCYSATNPSDDRFDVGRFNTETCARLRYSGSPTAEHSWFPPNGWINARCPVCPQQLGWVFADPETDAVCFAGIIVTNLIERRVAFRQTTREYRDSRAALRQQQEQHYEHRLHLQDQSTIASTIEILQSVLQSIPDDADEAARAAAIQPLLSTPGFTGALRRIMQSGRGSGHGSPEGSLREWLTRVGAAEPDGIEGGAYLSEGEDAEEAAAEGAELESAVAAGESSSSDDSSSSSSSEVPSPEDTADCLCVFCGVEHPHNPRNRNDYCGEPRVDAYGWDVALSDPSRGLCVACAEKFERQRYGGMDEWFGYDGPADGSFWGQHDV